MGDVCSYRATAPKDYAADYYLWPGTGCQKNSQSCAAAPPTPLATEAEIKAFVKKASIKTSFTQLPNSKTKLKALLYTAESLGQVTHLKGKKWQQAIYRLIQKEINKTAGTKRDVFIVIGTAHGIPQQTQLVNDIVANVQSITLWGLEQERLSCNKKDQQLPWDQYLLTGKGQSKLEVTTKPGSLTSQAEITILNQRSGLAYRQCINVALTDAPCTHKQRTRMSLRNYSDHLTMRDNYTVRSLKRKQDPHKRDVVIVEAGSTHADKKRLPAFIKHLNPKAHVVSVILNGGATVEALKFDLALREMGWHDKNFILRLNSHREGDYVVHLASGSRTIKKGVQDTVLTHLFDPEQ